MSSEKLTTILFLDRPRLTPLYIETIKAIKDKFKIVVLASQKDCYKYHNIPDIIVEEHIDEYDPTPAYQIFENCPKIISTIENELGINCYEFNINYLLYRKFASHYGVVNKHKYMNTHIPELLTLNYLKLKTIIEKYKIKYAFFETIDSIDSVILSAMVRKGILKQTFERGIFSIGGKVRMRLGSGKFKRSPYIDYILKNKSFSDEATQWAKMVIKSTKQKRQISQYDITHIKMGKILPDISFGAVINKLKRFIIAKEPLTPALIKIKNRLISQKYFSNELPKGNIISYFLQLTPEASMCYQAPRYANQDYLIEQIAINGKHGYNIVVKEHPRCFGNRNPQFYRDLSLLPNVTLLPPSFSNRDLILKSKALLSVGGTSPSLESIVSGTPVVTIGHPYFDCCENVYNINRPEELWDIIENISFNDRGQIDFLAALYEASSPHPEANTIYGFTKAAGLGPVLGKALENEINLYEQNILKPENQFS